MQELRTARGSARASESNAGNSKQSLRSSVILKHYQKFSGQISAAAIIVLAGMLLGSAATPAMRGQTGPADAQTGVSVEASQQVFSVMCALDAAGFAAD